MNRNLKMLWLALVAVFAMSAVTASNAAAEKQGQFTAEEYPAHIFAEDTDDIFTVLGQPLLCKHQTFTGVLASESTDITINPEYTKCENVNNKKQVTVTMNGCNFTFTAGTVTSATTVHGEVHITCPTGKEIEAHTYNDVAHTSVHCTLVIPPQTLPVTYTNHNGHVFLEPTEGTSVPVTGTEKGTCTAGLNIHFSSATSNLGVTVEGTESNAIDVG
jgi:hypothetical protein